MDTPIGWLLSDSLDLFLAKIQSWKTQENPDLKELVRQDLGYFENHRTLLRYAECKAANLPIGSGIIEGAVRFVGKDRLDRTGMRWSEAGAELLLQLRCADASHRCKSFTERRASKRQQNHFAVPTALGPVGLSLPMEMSSTPAPLRLDSQCHSEVT